LNRHENFSFGFGGRDMEGNSIKIRDGLVDIDRRGTGLSPVRSVGQGQRPQDSP
jgi:hypothetical protein